MTFIVATNVIAIQPPERRPTGTPHARHNKKDFCVHEKYQTKAIHQLRNP